MSGCWVKFLLVGFFVTKAFCAEETIEVQVDKERLRVGEIFNYNIKINGEFSSPRFSLPEFKDFYVVAQTQSQNYSFLGSKFNLSLVLKYQLLALKPGEFILEGISIRDGAYVFKSKPLKIVVSGEPLKDKRKILPFIEKAVPL